MHVTRVDVVILSGGNKWFPNSSPVPAESLRLVSQYLLDFETGEIRKCDLYNLSELLKRDQELYEEFMEITYTPKRKKQMYMFMNHYNERHPVYIPSEKSPAFNEAEAGEIQLKNM
jgi:hypothetical protein